MCGINSGSLQEVDPGADEVYPPLCRSARARLHSDRDAGSPEHGRLMRDPKDCKTMATRQIDELVRDESRGTIVDVDISDEVLVPPVTKRSIARANSRRLPLTITGVGIAK
jgi:hypothetical protein